MFHLAFLQLVTGLLFSEQMYLNQRRTPVCVVVSLGMKKVNC